MEPCVELYRNLRCRRGLGQPRSAAGEVGDQYLFLALDQDTKLIACHQIGKRTEETTRKFIGKLAARIILPDDANDPTTTKPQISTDGFNAYPNAILDTFGSLVQYGQIIKNYVDSNVGRPTPAMAAGLVDTLWKFSDLYDEVM